MLVPAGAGTPLDTCLFSPCTEPSAPAPPPNVEAFRRLGPGAAEEMEARLPSAPGLLGPVEAPTALGLDCRFGPPPALLGVAVGGPPEGDGISETVPVQAKRETEEATE